jgi:hypothetical protein
VDREGASGRGKLLRTGVINADDLDRLADQFQSRLGTESISGGDRYSLRVEIVTRDGLVSSFLAKGDQPGVFDLAMPSEGVFRKIWFEATRIPKVYWYREIGPIDPTARERLQGPIPDSIK